MFPWPRAFKRTIRVEIHWMIAVAASFFLRKSPGRETFGLVMISVNKCVQQNEDLWRSWLWSWSLGLDDFSLSLSSKLALCDCVIRWLTEGMYRAARAAEIEFLFRFFIVWSQEASNINFLVTFTLPERWMKIFVFSSLLQYLCRVGAF